MRCQWREQGSSCVRTCALTNNRALIQQTQQCWMWGARGELERVKVREMEGDEAGGWESGINTRRINENSRGRGGWLNRESEQEKSVCWWLLNTSIMNTGREEWTRKKILFHWIFWSYKALHIAMFGCSATQFPPHCSDFTWQAAQRGSLSPTITHLCSFITPQKTQ